MCDDTVKFLYTKVCQIYAKYCLEKKYWIKLFYIKSDQVIQADLVKIKKEIHNYIHVKICIKIRFAKSLAKTARTCLSSLREEFEMIVTFPDENNLSNFTWKSGSISCL